MSRVNRKTVDILGIQIDAVNMVQALEKVCDFLAENRVHTIYTPNAEIIMQARRDADLKGILNEADLLVADGAGVVLASRILKRPVPCKVSGIDLTREMFRLFSDLSENNGREYNAGNSFIKKPSFIRKPSFYLLGAKPGVAEKASENVISAYPGVIIAGYRNGYFNESENSLVVDEINNSGADILLVALGAPKQEKWINANKDRLNVKVCMGVGGTFDVLAGVVSPAPEILRRNGFEWLYRLYKEPWRAKRMMDLPRFMLNVFKARIAGR